MPWGIVQRLDNAYGRPIVVMRVPGIPWEVYGWTVDPDAIQSAADFQGGLEPGMAVYFRPGKTVLLTELVPCSAPAGYVPPEGSPADEEFGKAIQAELDAELDGGDTDVSGR